ncbi:hypothetical protein EBT31_05905 [bacterium]|jgi:hypothetical protein|nr:hypothetical protein [bacterium]
MKRREMAGDSTAALETEEATNQVTDSAANVSARAAKKLTTNASQDVTTETTFMSDCATTGTSRHAALAAAGSS